MRISSFSFLCQWVLDSFGKFEYGFTPIYFIYHYTQHVCSFSFFQPYFIVQSQALSIIAININRVVSIYFHNYKAGVNNLINDESNSLEDPSLLNSCPPTLHLHHSPSTHMASSHITRQIHNIPTNVGNGLFQNRYLCESLRSCVS